MKRSRPTPADLAASLTAVKLLIKGMNGAMPTLAAEMRRDACERIDDVIEDLGSMKR
ncbi:hypothetical protein HHL26_06620 [Sphingobium sp. TB-6]|uniref:hypothetical protein n=1 Tax=Sphingobium sp. TB-6 TaxID=2728850 RepID=UPI00146BCDE2|nr:hypothetical protein [Sphingobium sp. TB-6]NML88740.1 hypothetical protein [Sphingobium sp. TB-6]